MPSAQQDVIMIEDRISTEKVSELGEQVDIIKTKKVWQPRQGFGGDSTSVNSRRKAKSQDYAPKQGIKAPSLGFLQPLFYLLKYMTIILLIAGVIYIIVLALQQVTDDDDVDIYTAEELVTEEEDIREMDLDGMLRDALASGDHKLAIRARFLILLRSLTEKDLITWSQEKTNRDYIRELRKQPYIETFKQLTLRFELAWYGDQDVRQDDYTSFEVLTDDISSALSSYSTMAV